MTFQFVTDNRRERRRPERQDLHLNVTDNRRERLRAQRLFSPTILQSPTTPNTIGPPTPRPPPRSPSQKTRKKKKSKKKSKSPNLRKKKGSLHVRFMR